jgi:hypothetical protein
MTLGDLIKKAQEGESLPEGVEIPRATLRVGSAEMESVVKLEPGHDVELSTNEIEDLGVETHP